MHRIGAEDTTVPRRMMPRSALIGGGRARRVVIHPTELRYALLVIAGIGGLLGGIEMLLRGAGIGTGLQAADEALGIGDLRAGDARRRGLSVDEGGGGQQKGRGDDGGNNAHDFFSRTF